jgi:hypothetical protein
MKTRKRNDYLFLVEEKLFWYGIHLFGFLQVLVSVSN